MRILFLMLLYIIVSSIKAQPPGEPASNYTLVFEDEFDTLWNNIVHDYENQTDYHTDINITKWDSWDWNRPCHSPFRRRYFENAEVYTNGSGHVVLKSKREDVSNCPCSYKENGNTISTYKDFEYTNQMLYSKQAFKYGYFEIRFRLPQPPNWEPVNTEIKGIGPNFWMYAGVAGCECNYSEIDVYEIFGYNKLWSGDIDNSDFYNMQHVDPFVAIANNNLYYNGGTVLNQITHNVHYRRCVPWQCSCTDTIDKTDYYVNLSKSNLFADHKYHTIGMRWLPNTITYYIDGVYSHIYNNGVYPQNLVPMHLVVDINFSPEESDNQFLPYFYEVDYVKVWSLNDNCNNPNFNTCIDLEDSNNSFWGTGEETNLLDDYNNSKVYNQIEVSGENCDPIVIEPGINIDMKANKRIILKPGFHAKAGSKFKASIQNCETIVE